MAKEYLNQGEHNKSFLESISQEWPEDYFDWKVTVQFYTALHFAYCILDVNGFDIEESHSRNIKNLKKIDSKLSFGLNKLFKNSKSSRYLGFTDEEVMLGLTQKSFIEGKTELKKIQEATVPVHK